MRNRSVSTKQQSDRTRALIAHEVFGRAAQLVCVLLCIWGLSSAHLLANEFEDWLNGKLAGKSLCMTWLKVVVPLFVGIVMIVAVHSRLRENWNYWKSISLFEDSPWKAVPRWRSDSIAPNTNGRRILIVFSAAFWVLVVLRYTSYKYYRCHFLLLAARMGPMLVP